MTPLYSVTSTLRWRMWRPIQPVHIKQARILDFYPTLCRIYKLNPSLMFSGDRKIPTWGSNVPVRNKASQVSHWNGPKSWHFPVITEHQWLILFLTCHQENSAFFSRFSHRKAGTKWRKNSYWMTESCCLHLSDSIIAYICCFFFFWGGGGGVQKKFLFAEGILTEWSFKCH